MRNPSDLIALPAMRAWVASVRENTVVLPRPTDRPQVHADGADPDRVLMIGSGAAVGWGVLTHDLSLGGVVARVISARTGRGVDLDIIAKAGMTAESAVGILEAVQLWRYDAIVVALGMNEALDLTALTKFRRDVGAVLDVIAQRASLSTEVFVLGVPPIRSLPGLFGLFGATAQRHADGLDSLMHAACEARHRTHFIALRSDEVPVLTDPPNRDDYRIWGEIIGEHMAAVLELNQVSGERDSRLSMGFDDEARRQQAVDELENVLGPSPALERIVRLAQELFVTEAAIFTVLNRDRELRLAYVGLDESEVPRSSSFCALAIQQRGGMIVPDARDDARFEDNPLVTGAPHIRFYAGYPIESPSGEPIGALCVLDSKPRPATKVDQALLRQLALAIQSELRNAAPNVCVSH